MPDLSCANGRPGGGFPARSIRPDVFGCCRPILHANVHVAGCSGRELPATTGLDQFSNNLTALPLPSPPRSRVGFFPDMPLTGVPYSFSPLERDGVRAALNCSKPPTALTLSQRARAGKDPLMPESRSPAHIPSDTDLKAALGARDLLNRRPKTWPLQPCGEDVDDFGHRASIEVA